MLDDILVIRESENNFISPAILLSRYKFFWVDEILATYSVIRIPINTTLRRDKLPLGAVLFPILCTIVADKSANLQQCDS